MNAAFEFTLTGGAADEGMGFFFSPKSSEFAERGFLFARCDIGKSATGLALTG